MQYSGGEEPQSNADLIFLKSDKELESPSWNVCKMQLFAFLCFTAAESAEVMVIPDDDSNSDSDSDSSMVSIDSSLSSVLSVDTDSSIHLESSSPYSGYSDDSSEEDED